jgi:hypothetical protein
MSIFLILSILKLFIADLSKYIAGNLKRYRSPCIDPQTALSIAPNLFAEDIGHYSSYLIFFSSSGFSGLIEFPWNLALIELASDHPDQSIFLSISKSVTN